MCDSMARSTGAKRAAIVRQAAIGLEHAHTQGVIHRDIKPSNLIRSVPGTIKILDWGLAHCDALDSSVGGETRAGIGMGTDDYVAPEQACDAARADKRSDLYSLGCTLYFLLAGQAPFAKEGSPAAKLDAHQSKRPPPISQFRADVPQQVDAILRRRLLAKKPAERFDSARALVEALDTALRAQNRETGGWPWRRAAAGDFVGGAALAWWLMTPEESPRHVVPTTVNLPRHGPPHLEDLGMFFVPPQRDFEYVPIIAAGKLAAEPAAPASHCRRGLPHRRAFPRAGALVVAVDRYARKARSAC